MGTKSAQLQVRVTPAEKAAIKRLATQAGQDVSAYVLSRTVPSSRARLDEVVGALGGDVDERFALAALNDLLSGLAASELADAVALAPSGLAKLAPLPRNYVAALVEQACHLRGVSSPSWTHDVQPLETPHFATELEGLRLHLLRASPVPFKRRNLFVDSAIGARV